MSPQSDSVLWKEAKQLSNTTSLNPVSENGVIEPRGSKPIKKVGSGSTHISVSSKALTSNSVNPNGIAVGTIKDTGKTKSKVVLSSHGVSTTLLLNGHSLGTKKDTGVAKQTDTATVSTRPAGGAQHGWEYRAHSHHTLSTSKHTYVADTGDSLKF